MKKYRQNNATTPQSTYYKKQLSKTHSRAKAVGAFYLLAIIAFAAAAFLPFYATEWLNLGVMKFYKSFTLETLKAWNDPFVFMELACSAVYALMLVGLVVNVLRAFQCLNWLNKKTASREYGFNRPVLAMNDLGSIFSGSFAVIVVSYFLISVLSGAFEPNYLSLIVLGVGVVGRLLLGVWGAKSSYFNVEDGQITEEKRAWGRFSPFLRNLLQLAAVGGILYSFIKAFYLYRLPSILLYPEELKFLWEFEKAQLISYALQVLALLFVIVLIKHATAITEYNENGAHGSGMKVFRIFALLTALAAGGVFAVHYFKFKVFDEEGYKFAKSMEMYMLLVAGIALAMFVIELIMRKFPKSLVKETSSEASDDENVEFGYLPFEENTETDTKPLAADERPACVYIPMLAPMMFNPQTGKFTPAPQHPSQPIPFPYPMPTLSSPTHTPMLAPAQGETQETEEASTGHLRILDEKVEAYCPSCDKLLRIDGTMEYHRCPVCGKVFKIRVIKK